MSGRALGDEEETLNYFLNRKTPQTVKPRDGNRVALHTKHVESEDAFRTAWRKAYSSSSRLSLQLRHPCKAADFANLPGSVGQCASVFRVRTDQPTSTFTFALRTCGKLLHTQAPSRRSTTLRAPPKP
jgi:hypothetical protein